MKSFPIFCLIVLSFGLAGCAKQAVPFVQEKKKYTFYFDNNSNWTMGKVIERTDDGWFLINYEGKPRWINGNRAVMIREAQ